MAAKKLIKPMPDFAVFADTMCETPDVYEHLAYVASKLPFPVIRVSAGSLEAASLKVHTGRDSGKTSVGRVLPVFYHAHGKRQLAQRRCTGDFKVVPIRKFLHQFIKIGVTQWFGISTDEAGRMRESPVQYIDNRYPLIEMNMSRTDCINWLRDHGAKVPNKSSCYFCPFHRDSHWQHMKTFQPDQFQKAIDFERQLQSLMITHEPHNPLGYLHSSCKPLDTVIFSERSDSNGYINECEGHCGV